MMTIQKKNQNFLGEKREKEAHKYKIFLRISFDEETQHKNEPKEDRNQF